MTYSKDFQCFVDKTLIEKNCDILDLLKSANSMSANPCKSTEDWRRLYYFFLSILGRDNNEADDD